MCERRDNGLVRIQWSQPRPAHGDTCLRPGSETSHLFSLLMWALFLIWSPGKGAAHADKRSYVKASMQHEKSSNEEVACGMKISLRSCVWYRANITDVWRTWRQQQKLFKTWNCFSNEDIQSTNRKIKIKKPNMVRKMHIRTIATTTHVR